MAWLKTLTEFGDLAVLTPLASVILLWLLVMRAPRGAAWWAIAVVFCAGLTAALKVFFYGCPPTPDLHSPSGHTSFSTLVYGAMTLATAMQSRGLRRMIAIGGGASFILAIAASRLLLAHNASEVGLGLTIGTAALVLFGQSYWRHGKAKKSPSAHFTNINGRIPSGRMLTRPRFSLIGKGSMRDWLNSSIPLSGSIARRAKF